MIEPALSPSELIRFEILNRIIDIDIIIDSKSRCWLPKGIYDKVPDKDSYQKINVKFIQKRLNLHVLSAVIFLGYNFENQVLHKCDIKACFNPEHLYIGTQDDNRKDYSVRKLLEIPKGKILDRAKTTTSRPIAIKEVDTPMEQFVMELSDLELEE